MTAVYDQAPKAQTDPLDSEPLQAQGSSEQGFWKNKWVKKTAGGVAVAATTLGIFHFANGGEDEPSIKAQPSIETSQSELMPTDVNPQLTLAHEYTGTSIAEVPDFAQQNPDSFFSQEVSTQINSLVPFLQSNRADSLQRYKIIAAGHDKPVTDPSDQPSERLKMAQASINNIVSDVETVSRFANSANSAEILLSGVYNQQSKMSEKILPLLEKLDGSLGDSLRDMKVSEVSNVFTEGTFGDVHANGYETFVVKIDNGDEQVIQRFKDPVTGVEQDRVLEVMAPDYSSYINGELETWHP